MATATAEPRPDNTTANHTVPTPGSYTLRPMNSYYGYDDRALALEARVDGNFTGSTDQIIQWAACKWGWDEDVVRAIAVNESNWHQSQLGDFASTGCPPGYTPSCPHSFGIHQVKWTSDPVGSFPWSRDSTAFNLDASMMIHRVCYEGYTLWLKNSAPNYAAGDLWGCVGQWYSGYWHDSGAELYISHVQTKLTDHAWTTAGF